MSGDADNPRIWHGADVLVAPVGTTPPADLTSPWGSDWHPIGLLSEDGLTIGTEEESNDHWAQSSTGLVLVRTVRSKTKKTFTVTAVEDNPVVFMLRNPGSTQETTEGVTTREYKISQQQLVAVGFQHVDGGVTRRLIVPRAEQMSTSDVDDSPTELEKFELMFNAYPAVSTGTLYYEVTNNPASAVGDFDFGEGEGES